jgi:chromosome segregation ATPase
VLVRLDRVAEARSAHDQGLDRMTRVAAVDALRFESGLLAALHYALETELEAERRGAADARRLAKLHRDRVERLEGPVLDRADAKTLGQHAKNHRDSIAWLISSASADEASALGERLVRFEERVEARRRELDARDDAPPASPEN